MKTPEQFVNEECAVYNVEALAKAVAARDRQVIEACIVAADRAIDAARGENETDLRSVKYMVEEAIIALANPATPSPGTGTAAVPTPENCPACAKVKRHLGEGYVCAWHPAPAPAPVKPPATWNRCVKHGDELHFEHEYEPGTAARWALQDNIGRCPAFVPARTPAAGTAPMHRCVALRGEPGERDRDACDIEQEGNVRCAPGRCAIETGGAPTCPECDRPDPSCICPPDPAAEPGKPATCEHPAVHAEQTPLGLYCRECGEVVGP